MREGPFFDEKIDRVYTRRPGGDRIKFRRRHAVGVLQASDVRQLVRERQKQRTDREGGEQEGSGSLDRSAHHPAEWIGIVRSCI
jgi:hypothetical protein